MKALTTRHAGSFIAIGVMLLALLGASLLLGGCAAQHHLTPARPPRPERFSQAELDRTRYETVPDSLAPAAGSNARTKAGVLQRWRQQFQQAAARTQTGPAAMPRKCKGCTFNVVAGDQTNSTAGKKAIVAAGDGASTVVAGKKAGPIVQADSGASVQVATAKDQAAAGQGNSLQHVETKQSWLAAALPWLAGLAGAGLLYWLLLGGGGMVVLGWLRRKKSTDTVA